MSGDLENNGKTPQLLLMLSQQHLDSKLLTFGVKSHANSNYSSHSSHNINSKSKAIRAQFAFHEPYNSIAMTPKKPSSK